MESNALLREEETICRLINTNETLHIYCLCVCVYIMDKLTQIMHISELLGTCIIYVCSVGVQGWWWGQKGIYDSNYSLNIRHNKLLIADCLVSSLNWLRLCHLTGMLQEKK